MNNTRIRRTEASERSRWFEHIDLEFPILIVAVAATAYGCSKANELDTRSAAYAACAKPSVELTDACRVILGAPR